MDKENIYHLDVGHTIPSLTVVPTHMQLFMYSAITWNRHHVHYSKDAAQAEGLPDVVVHRGLMGNFLARMLGEWLGENGCITELSWKVLRSATPGQALSCEGVITEVKETGAGLEYSLDVAIKLEDNDIVLGQSSVIIEGN